MKHNDKKILYVEDEFITRDSMSEILKERFQENCVFTASNGMEGFDMFVQESPDLVITDMKMEQMNGDEMIDKIREINKNVPIMIISAYDSYLYTSIEHQNIADYIVKPVGKFNLLYKIENILYGN